MQTLSPLHRAALLLLFAEACFAGIGALVKFSTSDINHVQVVFFRNFFALLVMLPWLQQQGWQSLKTARPHLHLSRALSGIISMYCFFYIISQLPLAQAMMVLLLSPFIVPIIAAIWLKEHSSRYTLLAIMLGFAGVFFALPLQQNEHYSILLMIGFASACLVALTKTTLRSMASTEPAGRVVFYFSLLTTLLAALPLPWFWQPLSTLHWVGFAAMGVLAAAGQLAMTYAFTLAPAGQLGVWTYSSVVFGGLYGYLFWQEPVTLAWMGGVLLIFYAGFVSSRQRLF